MAVPPGQVAVAREALLRSGTMSRVLFLIVLISWIYPIKAQKTLEGLLSGLNNEKIPYVKVAELSNWLKDEAVLLLDSREREEFEVSHLPGALYVGYRDFDLKTVLPLLSNWNGKVVLYCSLGVRSEDIAEELEKAGVENIYNLYGGIFEWANQGFDLVNQDGENTRNVHAYNRFWGLWLNNAIKVYE